MKTHWLRWLGLCFSLWLGMGSAHALTPAEALTLAAGDGDERIATLNRLAAAGDEKGLALIRALSNDAVKVQGEQVLVLAADGSAADAVTGASAPLSDTAEDAVVNNRLRSAEYLITARGGLRRIRRAETIADLFRTARVI